MTEREKVKEKIEIVEILRQERERERENSR